MPKDHGIGAPQKRREDIRFLTGRGVYTDDLALHGQTAAVFVRSTVAHGRIKKIDTARATATPRYCVMSPRAAPVLFTAAPMPGRSARRSPMRRATRRS